MKYKVLGSAAHNFAHSFVSQMNHHGSDYVVGHVLRAVLRSGEPELRVDLLTGISEPEVLLTPEVAIPLGWYVKRFPHHVSSHGAGMHGVKEARMRLRFDEERVRRLRQANVPARLMIPFECSVEIVDDRGKVHVGVIREGWQSDWFISQSAE